MGGTYSSSIVSSAADLLWMSVMRGMRGVGGVSEMCVFGSGRLVDERIGFGFTNPVGRVFGLWWCMWGVGRRLGPGYGGVRWCYVCVSLDSV